jgi:purine-binding chemotaxis protein CheW
MSSVTEQPPAASPSEELAKLAGQAVAAEPTSETSDPTVALLLLRVGRRWFGVRPEAVRQVAMKGHVTRVPTAPSYVLGVTLIRGRLVPVIALEGLLGSVGSGDTAQTLPRLVVLRDADTEIAVVADETRGLIEHSARATTEPARSSDRASFLGAEIGWEGRLVCLLDVPALIAELAPRAQGGP